jgi:putative hemolysin
MTRLRFTLGYIWQRKWLYLRFCKRPVTKIQFNHSVGNYTIKTVQSWQEWRRVLKLRYEVFFEEFSGITPYSFTPKVDIDHHDFSCDHLIVLENKTDKIVATYRLRTSSDPAEDFYTLGEFNLDTFLANEGRKMELGRACVSKEFRQGPVLRLLWRGLCEYAALSKARYMFGCSSLTREEMGDWPLIHQHALKHNAVLPANWAMPIGNFVLSSYPEIQTLCYPADATPHKKTLSLLSMYLMAGAKIGANLAYDAEMDCVDIFTVIDMQEVNPSFNKRLSEAVP